MTTDPATEKQQGSEEEARAQPAPEMAYNCVVSYSRNQRVIHPSKDQWFTTAQALLEDGYRMCIDLTAVDYLTYRAQRDLPEGINPERYEVVAGFANFVTRDRIRMRTQVNADALTISSLFVLYPGSDFMEREVFDMFGIVFTGHPDLSRVLMPESWVGHPLRKDYAIGAIPVQFKGSSKAEGSRP